MSGSLTMPAWLTNALGISGSPSMQGADFSSMGDAGYSVPSSSDMNTASNFSNSAGGGMNWAGLSQGLGKLSDALGKAGGSTSSDPMQGSRSVAPSPGGTGAPSPAGGNPGGASALATADASRNQLAQYLLLAAMQGKGRGKSGQGLLG